MTITDADATAAPPSLPQPLLTVHRGDDELPWIQLTPEVEFKLAKVNVAEGLWIVRNRMQPGTRVQTHRHTGAVYAFTISGTWHYEESPDDVNSAGSFLFEPAGSTHTLVVPVEAGESADVWFTIFGANLNLDAEGHIESVLDAATILYVYTLLCEQAGLGKPPVVVE